MASKKEENEGQEAAEAKPKSNKMLIIIVAVVALLIGGGGAAVFVMMSGKGGKAADAEQAEAEAKKPKKAFYYEMRPPFVLNYQWNGRPHYLQLTVAVMSRDEDVIDLVIEHAPVLRNNLGMLLSAQDFDGMRSNEGKEALRQLIFEEIQKVIKENDEKSEGIDQVFYTNFVMQ